MTTERPATEPRPQQHLVRPLVAGTILATVVAACGFQEAGPNSAASAPSSPAGTAESAPRSSTSEPATATQTAPSSSPATEPEILGDVQSISWSRFRLAGLAAQGVAGISRVVHLDGRFVAFAEIRGDPEELLPAVFLVSDDGMSWRSVDEPPDVIVETAAAFGGEVLVIAHSRVAVEPERQLWRSSDGLTWRREMDFAGVDARTEQVHELVRSDSGWIALAAWQPNPDDMARETLLFASDDGIAWDSVPMPELEPFSYVRSITTRGDTIVLLVVGEDAVEQGVAWTYHTPDLENWGRTRITEQPILNAGDLLAGHQTVVAVGAISDRRSIKPTVWISENGGAWEAAEIRAPADEDAWVDEVHAVGHGYIALGSHGENGRPTAWWSPDGRTWEILPNLPDHHGLTFDSIRTAAIGTDRIVMVGQVSSASGESAPLVWLGRAP